MQFADCAMLFSEDGDAAIKGISNLEIIVVEAVLAIGFLVNQGLFHLLNRIDKFMRFFCHRILLAESIG